MSYMAPQSLLLLLLLLQCVPRQDLWRGWLLNGLVGRENDEITLEFLLPNGGEGMIVGFCKKEDQRSFLETHWDVVSCSFAVAAAGCGCTASAIAALMRVLCCSTCCVPSAAATAVRHKLLVLQWQSLYAAQLLCSLILSIAFLNFCAAWGCC